MTLKLETLKVIEGYGTSNWQDFNLVGLDTDDNRVIVATLSSYIGDDERRIELFKHTTIENTQRNLNNLKNYLQRNGVDNHIKWIEQSHDVRMKFIECFNEEYPRFNHG